MNPESSIEGSPGQKNSKTDEELLEVYETEARRFREAGDEMKARLAEDGAERTRIRIEIESKENDSNQSLAA